MDALNFGLSSASIAQKSDRVEVDHELFMHCTLHSSTKDLRQALNWNLITLQHSHSSPHSTAFAHR